MSGGGAGYWSVRGHLRHVFWATAGEGSDESAGTEPGSPSNDELLAALERLVEEQGIVEAGERRGGNYRTAAKHLDEPRFSQVVTG